VEALGDLGGSKGRMISVNEEIVQLHVSRGSTRSTCLGPNMRQATGERRVAILREAGLAAPKGETSDIRGQRFEM